jgi:hypothetical protein
MTTNFRLDELFNVEADFPLPDGKSVTIRVLTETEIQERDAQALRAYKEAEDHMQADDSEDRKNIIEPLEEANAEMLVAILAQLEAIRYSVEAVRLHPFRFFPFPDDAEAEERVAILRQQDKHEAEVRERRRQAVEDRRESYKARIQDRDVEDLRRMTARALIAAGADTARQEEFQVQTVYLSCRDGTQGPSYWSLEQVRQHGKKGGMSERVYKEVLSVYYQLDNVDPWELQKNA